MFVKRVNNVTCVIGGISPKNYNSMFHVTFPCKVLVCGVNDIYKPFPFVCFMLCRTMNFILLSGWVCYAAQNTLYHIALLCGFEQIYLPAFFSLDYGLDSTFVSCWFVNLNAYFWVQSLFPSNPSSMFTFECNSCFRRILTACLLLSSIHVSVESLRNVYFWAQLVFPSDPYSMFTYECNSCFRRIITQCLL